MVHNLTVFQLLKEEKWLKDGAIRLLQEIDFELKNVFGHPVVGWKDIGVGYGSLANPRGFSALRVIIEKLIEGKMSPLYDQVAMAENPGAIIVCKSNEKIGLVQSFRMTGKRLNVQNPADYIAEIIKEKRWEELLDSLGEWLWEAPRGISPQSGKQYATTEDLILDCAEIEAREEAGLKLTNKKIAGQINWNTTFALHPQYVVSGEVVSVKKQQIENLEIIGKVRFFDQEGLAKIIEEGKLVDALTLGAFQLTGIHC